MQILKEQNVDFEEIQYIKTPLSNDKLKEIASKLKLSPKEFIRKNDVKKLDLSIDLNNDEEIIQNMIDYPKIMERPIIVNGNKAVIGRPPEKILEIL